MRAVQPSRLELSTNRLTDLKTPATINHMVDNLPAQNQQLDRVFHALADPTRRSLLRRLATGSVLVKELAEPLDISKQAVSKHLHVLEDASLVVRVAEGRTTRVTLRPDTLKQVEDWVEFYRSFWTDGMEALADIVDGKESEQESAE